MPTFAEHQVGWCSVFQMVSESQTHHSSAQVNGCALLALTDKDLKDTYKMGTDQRRRLLTAVRAIPHPSESSPHLPATAISRSPTPTHEGARTPVLLGRLSSGGSPSRRCPSRGPKPEVKTDAKVNHTRGHPGRSTIKKGPTLRIGVIVTTSENECESEI